MRHKMTYQGNNRSIVDVDLACQSCEMCKGWNHLEVALAIVDGRHNVQTGASDQVDDQPQAFKDLG